MDFYQFLIVHISVSNHLGTDMELSVTFENSIPYKVYMIYKENHYTSQFS